MRLAQKEETEFHFNFNSSSALLQRAKLENWRVRTEFSWMVANPVVRIYGRLKIVKAKGVSYENGVSFDFVLRLHFKDNAKWMPNAIAVNL